MGTAALHVAALEGHVEIVRLLVDHGANPFVLNNESRTPLHIAVSKRHAEVVKILAANIKDRRERSKNQETITPSIASKPKTKADLGLKLSVVYDDGHARETEIDFLCPITKSIMEDPVVAGDGHTYEREAISQWIHTNGKSPITQERLSSDSLVPNLNLRHQIERFRGN